MRGNSQTSMASGTSSGNGTTPLRLVRSQQDAGFSIRPATIYDGDEPHLTI